jgi:hypothetical protein
MKKTVLYKNDPLWDFLLKYCRQRGFYVYTIDRESFKKDSAFLDG